MIDWWSETEHAVIDSLAASGPMSPQDLARFRAQLGLDAPWPVQFVSLLKQLVTGELHSLRASSDLDQHD